jgi:thymidylate kinase
MISIDIDGPSAVGKTTLIHQLYREMPNASFVDELLMQKSNPYSQWKTSEDFLKKQLWFFENTLRRYITTSDSKHSDVQINDIGIIDVIIHTAIFPIVNKLPWDIFTQFKNSIMNNYQDIGLANIVLYLYASEQVLRQRKSNDVLRARNAFESNIQLYPLQKKFYFVLANTYPNQVFCLDTDSNSTSLIKEILGFLNQNASAPPLHLYDLLNLTDSFF